MVTEEIHLEFYSPTGEKTEDHLTVTQWDQSARIENSFGDALYTMNGIWMYSGREIYANGTNFCVDYTDEMTVEQAIDWMREIRYKLA